MTVRLNPQLGVDAIEVYDWCIQESTRADIMVNNDGSFLRVLVM